MAAKMARQRHTIFIRRVTKRAGFIIFFTKYLVTRITPTSPAVISTRATPIIECLRDRYPQRAPLAKGMQPRNFDSLWKEPV